ncbi:MAG: hypothetical protein JWL73_384 [Actinomycetia bacterium]|nr:hypothetical protein [Actinomycetes bacterium]
MANGVNGIVALSVDSTDAFALASFWQQLLGGDVTREGDDAELVGGPVRIDFLHVPEAKSVKNRLHLDVGSDDYEAAIAHALRIGATRADDVFTTDEWQVMRDPEGNEFCILRPSVDG